MSGTAEEGLRGTAVDADAADAIGSSSTRAGRFAGPRILVVGCGDVGLRLVRRLGDRYRIHALARSSSRASVLRAAGVLPVVADLDEPTSLLRLGGLAPTVVHLAPPQADGTIDRRTRALCAAMRGVQRLIYISTTGVYGDCGGARFDETRTTAPQTDRARRRVDAETRLRLWAEQHGATLVILRVPGIYAADRLPLDRVASGTPVLRACDDVYTNHIHADDLARTIALAIRRGAPQRVYHAVDDSALPMGDWMDAIADAHRLPRPERVSRAELATRVGAERLSFMSESRRLTNRRLHDELGVRLDYPTVRDGLATCVSDSR